MGNKCLQETLPIITAMQCLDWKVLNRTKPHNIQQGIGFTEQQSAHTLHCETLECSFWSSVVDLSWGGSVNLLRGFQLVFHLQLKLQEHKLDFRALCQPNQSTKTSNPTSAVDLCAHELEKEWNGAACCQPLESSGSRWDTSTPSADATVHKRFFLQTSTFQNKNFVALWIISTGYTPDQVKLAN